MPEVLVSAEIPGLPPSVNHTYNYGKRNVYKDTSAKQWQRIAVLCIRKGKKHTGSTYLLQVECWIWLTTRTKRRMDCDNRVKSVQDCLSAAEVIKDDSQIWSLHVVRECGDHDATRIEVRTAA